jgi:GNAT superfamily N-acetyltransferase
VRERILRPEPEVRAVLGVNARRVGPDEIAPLHEIVAACGRDMHERLGFAHWVAPWPVEKMREDARERSVFAIEDDRAIVGTFTVGPSLLADYAETMWRAPGPALYLNRLAVRPELQGRGIGRFGMVCVEEEARRGGFRAIRFDAIAEHTALLAFYRALGYEERGPAINRGLPVICFEGAT